MEYRLVDFDEAHAETVLSWIQSPEELEAWAGSAELTLEPELFRRWHADPDITPFVFLAGDRLCAYGEIWEDSAEEEAELARIVVAPDSRGRGVGRQFVSRLAERAAARGYDAIWLRVLPGNAAAIAAYGNAGFVRATQDEETRFNAGQPRAYVWMRLASRSS